MYCVTYNDFENVSWIDIYGSGEKQGLSKESLLAFHWCAAFSSADDSAVWVDSGCN